MKIKNLVKTLSAVMLSAAFALTALSGCGEECDHQYEWTELSPATCTNVGKREGLCGVCGDIVGEDIPVNPDNHLYGAWEITQPTQTEEGKAVKICKENSEHVLEVSLPVLTDAAYTVTNPVQATVINEGERVYSLANDAGEITFTVILPKLPVTTVADAVLAGSNGQDQVRSAAGIVQQNTGYPYSYTYEFGENYTHITGGLGKSAAYEQYYSMTDGKIFGIEKTSATAAPTQIVDPSPAVMNGYGFSMSYYSISGFNGAEQLLQGLYLLATTSTNGDFDQSVRKNEAGEKVYCFSYGNLALSGDTGAGNFSLVSVEFTLFATNALKSMEIRSDTYSNSQYQGEVVKNFLVDGETGYASVANWDEEPYKTLYKDLIDDREDFIHREYISVEQTLKTPGEEEPVNPYDKNSLIISSFDVMYAGKPITDETISGNNIVANSAITFNFANILPTTAGFKYDEPAFYYRTVSGDTPVNWGTMVSVGMTALFSSANSGSVTVRCKITGNITFVIKTQKFEKVINLYVKRTAPSKIIPQVYEYRSPKYVWTTLSLDPEQSSSTAYASREVTVGTPLTFRASVPTEEKNYAGNEVKVTLREWVKNTSGNYTWGATLDAQTAEKTLNDEKVLEFTAEKEGRYRITMQSEYSTGIFCTFEINVVEAPEAGDLLSGTYTGVIQTRQYSWCTVEVTFEPDAQQINGGTVNVVIVSLATKAQLTSVLSYSYTESEQLVTAYKEGYDGEISLKINEHYEMVLVHPTGFGSAIEEVILSKQG